MIKGRKAGYEKTLSFQALKEGSVRVSSLDFARDDQINNAITLRLESQKCGFISSLGLRLAKPDKKAWLKAKMSEANKNLKPLLKQQQDSLPHFPKSPKVKLP